MLLAALVVASLLAMPVECVRAAGPHSLFVPAETVDLIWAGTASGARAASHHAHHAHHAEPAQAESFRAVNVRSRRVSPLGDDAACRIADVRDAAAPAMPMHPEVAGGVAALAPPRIEVNRAMDASLLLAFRWTEFPHGIGSPRPPVPPP